jgi:hypothetical protein
MVEARNMGLLQESAAGTIADRTATAMLARKWAPLLEGIDNPATRGVMAILIENQFRHMDSKMGGALTEASDTKTDQLAYWTKFIYPVLRKVFPNLIANEIVSVQPMTAPVGAVFFFKYLYGSSKGGVTKGDEMIANFNRYYSSEYIDGEVALASASGSEWGPGGAGAYTLNWFPVRPKDSSVGWKVLVQDQKPNGTVDQEAEDDGAGGFTGDVTAGAVDYATGAITAFQFTANPASGNVVKVFYRYNSEFNSKLPEIYLELAMETIKAESRKLKIRWSPEASDDLRAMMGMDAESELVTGISQEATLELDREIVMDLLEMATVTTDTWDRAVPAGQSEIDWIRRLITVLSGVSNQIHKKTLRSPANFIVTSPEVCALISQLSTHGDFRPVFSSGSSQSPNAPTDFMVRPPSYGPITSDFGIVRVGTLSSRWAVYQDPFMTANKILLGLKGKSFMDAGYVWSPYIPLEMTSTFLHPDDQGLRKGLRTRSGKKRLRAEFYGSITVNNL